MSSTSSTRPSSAPPTSPRDPSELKFTPQRMVGWFDPRQLLSTGVQALLSEVFGSYADKRELQAALRGDPGPHTDYAEEEEIWVDFVADLGDGFDSTFTVATLLAQPTLTADGGEPTTRGRVLIMGGDQVYPVARRKEYQNRLQGPYEAAFPYAPDETRPHLFAIPGNHDWYDGLTSFLRVFCQGRGIGAWQTRQSRSYFALQLPHRWWVLGTDIQLETDIDRPQLEFFMGVCRDHMQPGDRVILCTAQPAWVDVANGRAEAYENLSFFEQRVIETNKASLVVTLTGDLHHYARYESVGADQCYKITAGGGGAFLAGTHDLPEALQLPKGTSTEQYKRSTTYPTVAQSRRMSLGAVGFLLRNRWFAVLLGTIYLFYAWLLQSASRRELGAGGGSFMDIVARLPVSEWWSVVGTVWKMLVHNPGIVAMLSLVVIGLALFSVPEEPGLGRKIVARAAGAVHGVLHIALTVSLVWWFAHLNERWFHVAPLSTAPQSTLFSIAMLIVGSIGGGMLMGAYLVLVNQLLGLHRGDVFAAQSIADYKNFLRLHVARDGSLTIRAFGIDRACRRWRFKANAPVGAPWMVPEDPIGVRLIDQVTIAPGSQSNPGPRGESR